MTIIQLWVITNYDEDEKDSEVKFVLNFCFVFESELPLPASWQLDQNYKQSEFCWSESSHFSIISAWQNPHEDDGDGDDDDVDDDD